MANDDFTQEQDQKAQDDALKAQAEYEKAQKAKQEQEEQEIKERQQSKAKYDAQVKKDYNKIVNLVNKIVDDKKKSASSATSDPKQDAKTKAEAEAQQKKLDEEKKYIEDKCEKYNLYAVGLGKTYTTKEGLIVYNYDLYKFVEKLARETEYYVFKRQWTILDGLFWKWRRHGFNYYKMFVDSFQMTFRDHEYRTWNHLIYLLCHLSKQPDTAFLKEYKNTNMDNYLDIVRENLGNQAYNNIDRYYKEKQEQLQHAIYLKDHPVVTGKHAPDGSLLLGDGVNDEDFVYPSS